MLNSSNCPKHLSATASNTNQTKVDTQLLAYSTSLSHCAAGPDRALFLPGGLLDRNDLPDYLDGTLAGE